MVALVIAGILYLYGLPAMREVITNIRVISTANELEASLNFARSEALGRYGRVTLCASTNGTACVSADEDEWEVGWIIYFDQGGTDGLDPPSDPPAETDDEILRVYEAVDNMTIREPGNPDTITYNAQGQFPPPPATFYICSDDEAMGLELVVSSHGRIRREEIVPGDNCPEPSDP